MNKPITEKDFQEELYDDDRREGASEKDAHRAFELAKKMCIDFAKFLSVSDAEGKFKMYQEWKANQ